MQLGGDVFGIKLFSDGVIVAALSEIYADGGLKCPAREAGIQPGDYILSVNGNNVETNAALSAVLSENETNTLTLRRGTETFTAQVTSVLCEGSYKAGMWVRDSAAGIGTVTFYTEDGKAFGALGHGICDADTRNVLEIRSGERIRLTGDNGTGKTTLVRLLTGELEPTAGRIGRADFSYVCLDQQYSRVNTPQSVLELAQSCNHGNLQDHELKLRLHRALFGQQMWDKRCDTLSGGERMRLCLCSLMIANHVPDLFVLDEPTNNLDLSSLAILTRTVRNYRGTLLVVSHDGHFTDQIGITRTVELE